MDATDCETGEILLTNHFEDLNEYQYDMETGECDANITTQRIRKTKFVIPKELIQPQKDPKAKCCCIDPNDNFTLSKKEEVIGLQEVIIKYFK